MSYHQDNLKSKTLKLVDIMCDECREKHDNCDFCNIEERLIHTYFSKEKEGERKVKCNSWIDFEKKDGEYQWYAVLNGDQYTWGHSMVILGYHMDKITEPLSEDDKRREKLRAMMEGINRVSGMLKKKLNAPVIHVLGLCEGMEHLHFHLIPRYPYSDDEVQFFKENFAKREAKADQLEAFNKRVEKKEIHGMWYDGYKEMNYVFSEYNQKSIEERVEALEKLADLLRS
ncbi:MAG: HIT family protein [Candidatus Thorarchaeota archaeon]